MPVRRGACEKCDERLRWREAGYKAFEMATALIIGITDDEH
jgi:hypothetical protein